MIEKWNATKRPENSNPKIQPTSGQRFVLGVRPQKLRLKTKILYLQLTITTADTSLYADK